MHSVVLPPPGPVGEAFLNGTAPTEVIMGPVGGGKTTLCMFKILLLGTQAPIAWHPADGKPTRMMRSLILRDTFRAAEKSVLKSWQQWFSKTYPGSTSQGGNDRPFSQALRFVGEDGIRMESIVEIAGLNEHSIEEALKGGEYSLIWLNELDQHVADSLDQVEQRVGRYPKSDIILTQDELHKLSRQMKTPIVSSQKRVSKVLGDMNAPTIDNWTYKTLVTNRRPGREFYQQPSGLSPQAENRFNLPEDYYERMAATLDEHFVRRSIENQFGYSRSGKPVHPTFRHDRHVAAAPIAFMPNVPLLLAIDASTNALTPGAVLGQVRGNGGLSVIDELAFEHGYGPARFGEALKRLIDQKYARATSIRGWIDPAALHGGDREGGQLAAMEILGVILGIPLEIPFNGSNEIALRLDAVNIELRGYTDADTALQISPNCTRVIEALAGRYRFKRLSESASNDYQDQPEKSHPWSDLMDALQYLAGGIRGRAATMRALMGGKQGNGERSGWGGKRASSRGGFDPHNF